MNKLPQTIFALSTAAGRSAVAVIRLTGPDCLAVLASLSGKDDSTFQARTMKLATIVGRDGRLLDKVMLVYFPAPKSFTGEDCAEIHCHGSAAAIKAILSDLSSRKHLRSAEPGEFTRRAFDNDKMDLSQVEGLGDLINAQTQRQLEFSLRQISGAALQKVSVWRTELVKIAAFVEAFIDFPDEDLPDDLWKQSADRLTILRQEFVVQLANGQNAKKIEEGVNIVLVGPPNAGKSSLLNALAQEDRAIVSDIAGTTRDTVSVTLDLGGLPARLTDTAGLRESDDSIELLGVERSLLEIDKSDLVLFLYDLTDMETSHSTFNGYGLAENDKLWKIYNKSDLVPHVERSQFVISAKSQFGTSDLTAALALWIEESFAMDGHDQFVAKERHMIIMRESIELIDRSLSVEIPELFAENIRMLSRNLGRIIGQVDVEDLLDSIFGDFCIGK
jgi:tRNA modification GTPase